MMLQTRMLLPAVGLAGAAEGMDASPARLVELLKDTPGIEIRVRNVR